MTSTSPRESSSGLTRAAQVRGMAFLGVVKQLRAVGASIEQIVAEAPEATRTVFASRIRVLGWYPYEAFAGLLRAVDRKLGNGDLAYCRYLGEVASEMDLGTVFSFLAKLCSAERLIRACGRVWGQYYRDAGRMEALAWSPEKTVLRIYGFPRMDPAHCQLMIGWMIQSMKTVGVTVTDEAETQCTSRGGPYHEFTCRWSR